VVLSALLMLIQLQGPAFGRPADAAGHASDVAPHVESRSHEGGALLAAGIVDPETEWLAAARRHITLREYRSSKNAAGLQAPSRRHALRTYFEPTGIRIVDRVAEGSPQLLALRLEQMGRANALAPVAPGEVASDGAWVQIRRGSVLEWYVNSPAGLEQGFTLSKRTEGEGPLVLDLSLEGAEASWSGESVRIVTATGRKLAYGQLTAVDALGTPLPVELSVPSARRLQLWVDDTSAVYPIVIDPLLTAAAETLLKSDQATAFFGFSVAGAGDVNGDGYADVIVGAWRYDAGETDEGAAFIFHGSAAGIADATPATAHTRLEGDQAGAEMGEYVAGAGDVNGDGFADVIVGAWHYDAGETDEGAAFVFHGSAAGIVNGTPATAHTRLAGDQAGAQMGISVDGAGDVNGDGYADVIVGAHTLDAGESDEGAAFVFHGSAAGIADGSPATAQARLESDQADAWMGVNVGGAGDVNGDGYADVIVGARRYDAGESDEGAAFIFHGSAAGIADGTPATAQTRLVGDQADAWMGYSVDGAGDFNGDGYGDVIVGAGLYDAGEKKEGAAFLFLGSASGIADASPSSAHAMFESDQAVAWMGSAVSGAGDVNGDGYADVIIGAWRYDAGETDEGAAFVFLGGDLTGPEWRLRSDLGSGSAVYYFVAVVAAVLILLGSGAGLLALRRRRRGSPSKPSS